MLLLGVKVKFWESVSVLVGRVDCKKIDRWREILVKVVVVVRALRRVGVSIFLGGKV